jgi:hypothetical protein
MRRQLRVAYKNLDNLNPAKMLEYQQMQSAYNKAIRKAKKESWRSFIDSITTIADTSKLTRLLTRLKTPSPGLTVTPNGVPTWSSLESIQNIMQNLFPGAKTSKQTTNATPSTNLKEDGLETDSWISQESIEAIIQHLHLSKAPGPDQITNKMLKNLPKKVIVYLTHIYKLIIKFSHVPMQWCKSKAIFLPKAGKANQNDPKSFRPICLSNTLFKVLEKLIQAHLEQAEIYPKKLTPRQHGFRPSRSTLTALSQLTNYIETSKHLNQQTIAVFLDIQGAFDNISPQNAIKILKDWGTPEAITNTLLNYYSKREIITSINPSHKTLTIYPTKGTAQGNVLSRMLWNCIANKLGTIMDKYNLGDVYLQMTRCWQPEAPQSTK